MRDVTVVGASLAGLATARALRAQGFTGTITVVGDEKHARDEEPSPGVACARHKVAAEQIPLKKGREVVETLHTGTTLYRLETIKCGKKG